MRLKRSDGKSLEEKLEKAGVLVQGASYGLVLLPSSSVVVYFACFIDDVSARSKPLSGLI